MRDGHAISRWRIAGAASLGLLLACTSAFGSLGAHCLGTSRDHSEFRLSQWSFSWLRHLQKGACPGRAVLPERQFPQTRWS